MPCSGDHDGVRPCRQAGRPRAVDPGRAGPGGARARTGRGAGASGGLDVPFSCLRSVINFPAASAGDSKHHQQAALHARIRTLTPGPAYPGRLYLTGTWSPPASCWRAPPRVSPTRPSRLVLALGAWPQHGRSRGLHTPVLVKPWLVVKRLPGLRTRPEPGGGLWSRLKGVELANCPLTLLRRSPPRLARRPPAPSVCPLMVGTGVLPGQPRSRASMARMNRRSA
jgi:hypothetical protein